MLGEKGREEKKEKWKRGEEIKKQREGVKEKGKISDKERKKKITVRH